MVSSKPDSERFVSKLIGLLGEPQWAVVGDTFVVGCEWSKNIVYRDESFEGNPDGNNPKYRTKLGIYKENIGLEQLTLSWGHGKIN